LIIGLWGERPPRSAAKTVQAYVSALRRVLPTAAIETAPGGYRLCLTPDQVDAVRFENVARRGGQAHDQGDYGLVP
jgi:DNA-binding SARP family transcriptional activator